MTISSWLISGPQCGDAFLQDTCEEFTHSTPDPTTNAESDHDELSSLISSLIYQVYKYPSYSLEGKGQADR